MARRLPLALMAVGAVLVLGTGAAVATTLIPRDTSETVPGLAPLSVTPTATPSPTPSSPAPAPTVPSGSPEYVYPADPHDVGDDHGGDSGHSGSSDDSGSESGGGDNSGKGNSNDG